MRQEGTRVHLEVDTPAGLAHVDLRTVRSARAVLVLGHGAGGSVDTPDLSAITDAALSDRIAVVLVTQPYRVAGKRAPVAAPRLDEAWCAVARQLRRRRGWATLPFVFGGRSSGARVACRTAVATDAAAVIALAFPLHPPGKPEKSRLDELAAVPVPVLVVQGDRDAFGMPTAAPGRQLAVIAGADHSLKKNPEVVAAAVIAFLNGLSFLEESPPRAI